MKPPEPPVAADAADGADALGIDLGGTKIEAVRLAPDGSVRWRQRTATPAGSYDGTLAALRALVQAARAAGPPALHIGICSPGSAGSPASGGLMKNCNSTCLNGRPLQRDLQALLGQPVALANDANCLALSEATDGAGAGAAVVFAAILGTGCGAGIAVHGRVLTGPNGLAGEWGHNPLPWRDASAAGDGPPLACYCGQRGCIETLLSGPALARDHAARHPRSLAAAAQQIAQAAAGGDVDCAATLERHAERLARALASVVNLLDPDCIVLGGGLSRMPHLYARVPALWERWVFGAGGAGGVGGVSGDDASGRPGSGGHEPVRTRLVPALHGDASGVRGAAWLGRALAASTAQAESAP